MKRTIAVILSLTLSISLCGCVTRSQSPEETTGSAQTTVSEEPVETTVPEVPEAAFDDYACVYEEARDRAWEEDVIYFARLHLGEYVIKGHPSLTARLISITDLNNSVTQRYFYDAALRDAFIAEVNALLAEIPELTDDQIVYALMRISALLGDAHTSVYYEDGELFPFVVEQMEQNGELGLYVTRIPAENTELIYSRLVSVNNIPVEEVMARLMPYISTENEYWASNRITSIFNSTLIADKTALQAVGVMGLAEDSAVFGFQISDGRIVNLKLSALDLTSGEYWKDPYVNCTPNAMGFLSYSQYGDTSYFYKYLEIYDTMYIRLYDCSSDAEYRLGDLLEEVDQQLRVIGPVDKIVVDVRNNPGGYLGFVDGLIKFLGAADTEDIYILIDNGSCSAATIFPHRARAKLDNVTIVGSHSAQRPNFFAGATSLKLRQHDVYFTISMSYFEGDPDFTGEALEPDVLVYQSLEDYMMRIDTVLQTVLDQP